MRIHHWLFLPIACLAIACSDSGGTDATGSSGTSGKAGSGGSLPGGAGGSAGNTGGAGGTNLGGKGGVGGSTGGTAGKGAEGGNETAGGGNGGSTGTVTCDPGFADCDKNPANGCEVNLTTDAIHCGTCEISCTVGADNALGVCIQGACSFACNSGYANCDQDVSNGCEVNLQNNIENCGYCGNACTSQDGTPMQCLGGACSLQCSDNKQDCNQNAADGCEVDTSNDPKNCGSCGNSCDGGKCVQGTCECAGTSSEAKSVELAMFVMLDKSGSMLDSVSGGSTRWDTVKQALNQFFSSAEAAGIKVALNYFPLQASGGTTCDSNYYYNPAVPMGVLPGTGGSQLNALSNSMSANTPSGGTPTNVALGAALSYAADWKKTFPKDKAIVVLATDGQPGDGCGATLENSAAAAAAGLSGNISVPTYVIGVGSSTGNLDTIADAGGSSKAFIVNDGNTSAFIEALKQIKLQAIACEFSLPTPPSGTVFNKDKVNFEYSPGGGQPKTLGNVANNGACDPDKGGWYYDDPQSPSKILLCPSSCTTLQADTAAKVNILLGCDTFKE